MSHLTVQQLSSSLDGAVTGPSLELVVRHLAGCAECRDRQSRLARHDDVLRRLLAPAASTEFLEMLGARGEDIAVAIARGVPPPEMTTSVPLLDDEDPHAPSEPRPAERPGFGLDAQLAQEAGYGRIGVKPGVQGKPPESDPEEAKRLLEAIERGQPVKGEFVVEPKPADDTPGFDLPTWLKERASSPSRPMPMIPRQVQKLKLVFDPAPKKVAREKAEREKAEREKAERENAERERAEREKAERERAEREKAEREKAQLEAERAQIERARAELDAERTRIESERAEREKVEREKAEREEAERERAERERAQRERAVREQAERERAEQKKAELEAERARVERERAEQTALEAERAQIERARAELVAERTRVERERAEREKAERERAEREAAERERAEREAAERLKAEIEAERARIAREKAELEAVRAKIERERAEDEKAERAKAKRAQAEREKAMREQAEREQAEREKAERERAERDRNEREKTGRESPERDSNEDEEEPMSHPWPGSRGEPDRGPAPYGSRIPRYEVEPTYESAIGIHGDTGSDDPFADPAAHAEMEPGPYATRERARAAVLRRSREEARRRGLRVHWFLAGGSVGTLLLVVVSLQLMPVTREGERVASRFRFPRIELPGRDSVSAPTRGNGAPELHSATTPVPVESVVPPTPRVVPQDSSATAPKDTSADSTDGIPGR